jgi:hypothetical protein
MNRYNGTLGHLFSPADALVNQVENTELASEMEAFLSRYAFTVPAAESDKELPGSPPRTWHQLEDTDGTYTCENLVNLTGEFWHQK